VAIGGHRNPSGVSSIGSPGRTPGFRLRLPKLTKKILAKEYVDIWELLPETWQVETEGTCCHTKRPRRSLVTNINVWTECFATMAAILAVAFPSKAPHFFAYLCTITKASRTFESAAWATYDMAYRRQAANRGSLDWGIVDAALYNEAFAAREKQIPRCQYCLADTHSSRECLHAPADPLPSGTSHGANGRPLRAPRSSGPATRLASSVDICWLFNALGGPRCKFLQCRYAHLCSKCKRGPHPAAESPERRQQATPTQSGTGSSRRGSPPLPTI
jgi:hypothetical protein